MNALAVVVAGEARIDTRVMADHLGVQHQNLFEMVKDYKADFEALGKVRFETGLIEGRGRPVRFALLNEDQCYLMLTFSRNTERVRPLKVKLVQAFKQAREARKLDETEYLPGYHQLHDVIHRLAAGSSNERFIHMNMNKAINKAVGIDAGQRGTLEVPAKSLLVVAQMVAALALQDAKDHKDGYQRAKDSLSELHKAISRPAKAA